MQHQAFLCGVDLHQSQNYSFFFLISSAWIFTSLRVYTANNAVENHYLVNNYVSFPFLQCSRFCGKIACYPISKDYYHDYSWGSPIKDPKANLILAFLDFGVLVVLIVEFPGWSFFFTKSKVTSHFITMHRVNQESMAMKHRTGWA